VISNAVSLVWEQRGKAVIQPGMRDVSEIMEVPWSWFRQEKSDLGLLSLAAAVVNDLELLLWG
jgi:hypothetical protein